MQPPPDICVGGAAEQDRCAEEQPVSVRRPCTASHTNAVEEVAPKVKPADAPPSATNTGVNTTPGVAVVGSVVGEATSATQPSAVPLSAHRRPKYTATAVTAGGVPIRATSGDVTTAGLKSASAPPAVHTTSPSEAAPLTGTPVGPDAEALVSSSPRAVRRANTRGTAAAGDVESAPPAALPSGAS